MGFRAWVKSQLYQLLEERHAKRWQDLADTKTSPTKFRVLLFLSSHNPTSKSAIVDFLMERGVFDKRESAIRVVDRHLSDLQRSGLISFDQDGTVKAEKMKSMVVGETPGIWVTVGIGLGIVITGLGLVTDSIALVFAGLVMLAYSTAIVVYFIMHFSPY